MNEFYEVQLRHTRDDEEGWCEVGVYDTLANAWFSYSDCITHDIGQDIDVMGYQIQNGLRGSLRQRNPSLIRGCGYDALRIIYVAPMAVDHVIVVAYQRYE